MILIICKPRFYWSEIGKKKKIHLKPYRMSSFQPKMYDILQHIQLDTAVEHRDVYKINARCYRL
jgi:hypothetical protein